MKFYPYGRYACPIGFSSIGIAVSLAVFAISPCGAFAANQTWSNTGSVSANWSETTNWGGATAPGATSGSASVDFATFNTAAGTYGTSANPIIIDSGCNIKGIISDTNAGNYTIGTISGNALNMTAGSTIQILSTLSTNNATITINAPLLMYGGLAISNIAPNGSNKIVIGGTISAASSGSRTLSISSNGTNSTNINEITGLISNGNGTVSVTQTTAGGIWYLTNNANSFTGNLSVQAGFMYVTSIGDQGVASSVGSGTTINLGSSTSTANFYFTGIGQTTNRTINLAGTTGGAKISANNASGLLKFTSDFTATGSGVKMLTLQGTGAGGAEVAGRIVDSASGSTSVTKSDAGTWTLSGNNTYSGATTVSAGILVFQNKATRAGGSLVSVAAAGTVGLGVGGGGVTDYTDAEVASLFNSTLSGFTLDAASSIAIDTTAGNFNQSTALTASRALTKLSNNTLTLSGNNSYSGTTTISAGTLEIGSAGRLGGGNYSQNITNNGAFIYSGANQQTFSGIISGSGSLNQNGSSTLILSNANTYSGATTINAGTLQIGTGSTTGSISSSSAITNNGTLAINRSDATTFSNTISGSGGLLKAVAAISLSLEITATRAERRSQVRTT
jgi:fibronectin-binding autotransporter adhesin